MKTRTKALLLFLGAILLVVSTMFATMAYLQYETAPVTNTFTVGNVSIKLYESKTNEYGETVDVNESIGPDEYPTLETVTANEYKLIPGHTYTKNPIVEVAAGSEDCYLFVKIENDLADILDDVTIATQMTKNDWTEIGAVNGIWAYNKTATAGKTVPTFETITVKDDADVEQYATETDVNGEAIANVIQVIAYAVQADGFNSASAAWEATFGAPVAEEPAEP